VTNNEPDRQKEDSSQENFPVLKVVTVTNEPFILLLKFNDLSSFFEALIHQKVENSNSNNG